MKKISEFIVKARYYLLAIFVILVGASCYMMTQVNINYNILNYLDKDSTSTIALNKMEEEFGSSGQAQIMVSGVTFSEALNLKDKLTSVDGVQSVAFASSETDTEYFILDEGKDTGSALYKVFLVYGNFDVETKTVVSDVKDVLSEYTIALNGGAIDSVYLSDSLDKDMTIILLIAAAVVFVILLITSTSWIEPLIFAIVACGAILINMGTNIILNYIPYINNSMSFITQSIAAVMQLALAMDYSIILLNSFKAEKQKASNTKEALVNALTKSFAPISSSSITTVVGLAALMFMSFSIGFDVGLVLAKGIIISLLSVFLFMPALILLFDKLIEKTTHRTLFEVIKGKRAEKTSSNEKRPTIAGFQDKTKITIPVIVSLLIIIGAVLNFKADYSYSIETSTDSKEQVNVDDANITAKFGTQNTLVVMIPKEKMSDERAIASYLLNYEYNGEKIINSYQGLASYGIYTEMNSTEISQGFGLPSSIVNQVFTLMGLGENDKTTIYSLINFMNDNNVISGITAELQEKINTVNTAYTVKLTSTEFSTAYNLDSALIGAIYQIIGQEKLTAYEVLDHVYTDRIVEVYFSNTQGQAKFDAMYNSIPAINATLSKEEAKALYSVDDDTLTKIFQAGNVSNQVLFGALSASNYYVAFGNTLNATLSETLDSMKLAVSMFESDNYVRAIFNMNMALAEKDSFKVINEITEYLNSNYSDSLVVSESYVYSQIKDTFNSDMVTVNLISFFAILLIIAITFKSAFIPVLLTVIIQGSIWITMGISTMFGSDIFFVCYLVVMCIQMGATVDYAILITNNYTRNRLTMNKKDSIALAMKDSIPTILTSGSILILATLIIGLVSNVAIVSELGLLLSRGCLISVLMIILCLPQFLLLTDKIIEKTTFKTRYFKENK